MATLPTEYKKLASEYISFKSISTDPEFKSEVRACASWLKNLLKKNGFRVKVVRAGDSNPVIIANYEVSKDAETVLVYGHYDVQPAAKSDGWDSDPFKLTEKKGRLIARGAIDNKGQFMVHLYTILKLKKAGMLKYNIKFLIEGNEETGSGNMPQILKENKSLLTSDHIVVSDGETANNLPTMESSFRGNVSFTVTYQTAKTNLHSGLYGGAIPNAAHELSQLIGKFHKKNNSVAIPGFYDGVDSISKEQRKIHKELSKGADVCKITGVQKLLCEPGNDTCLQTGLRPSLQITGLKSGYIAEGYCNIIPSHAETKVNVRIAPSQDPKMLVRAFKEFIKDNSPEYVKVSIDVDDMIPATKLATDTPIATHIKNILKKAYAEKNVVVKTVGGSLPIMHDFQKYLKKVPVSVSLGNPDCNMHGINENFSMKMVEKGLKFSEMFFAKD